MSYSKRLQNIFRKYDFDDNAQDEIEKLFNELIKANNTLTEEVISYEHILSNVEDLLENVKIEIGRVF